MKTYRLGWCISLIVIVAIIIICTVARLADVVLPDLLIRIFGVLDLCAIVVLAFTTVKLRNQKKEK